MSEIIERVKNALLCMQRYSWEQGVAAQAFLELDELDMVILLAKDAALHQLADGRLGVIGNATAVTDPAANGEALLAAVEATGEEGLKVAKEKMLDWLISKAPRNKDGALYHVHDRPQVWVDSFYMAPPLLAAAGYYQEAIDQVNALRRVLFDNEKKLYSHMWNDDIKTYARKDFWGVGNGWALSGMTRVVGSLPETMEQEKRQLIHYIMETLEVCLTYMTEDGLFHDVVDDKNTFIETNTSQMLSYVIFRGICEGWCDNCYVKYAEKMRQAAHKKVDRFGLVQGVCGAPYFDRPGVAAEGQAFFLLMEAAAQKLYTKWNNDNYLKIGVDES